MHLTLRWLEAHVFCPLSIAARECCWQLAAACRATAVCKFLQRFAMAIASFLKWTPWVSTAWCATPAPRGQVPGTRSKEGIDIESILEWLNPRERESLVCAPLLTCAGTATQRMMMVTCAPANLSILHRPVLSNFGCMFIV